MAAAVAPSDDLIFIGEESTIQLQLQEARRALQMSRDAAEALRLAIGVRDLDESFPEVAERRRLEYQESELMRALESWQGRRTAVAQEKVGVAQQNITQYDAHFAR
ncbi:hypothetical protein T484DRAFT_1794718 [Baffinella frigidus]|nr:hypothetical protein T484DRAFT_1794718 [Cryptophyta sp. CCMP2293]